MQKIKLCWSVGTRGHATTSEQAREMELQDYRGELAYDLSPTAAQLMNVPPGIYTRKSLEADCWVYHREQVVMHG